jgi:hypothetical protein
MDINITVNVEAGKEEPTIKVQQPLKKKKGSKGGVLQFPEQTSENNPILDILGINKT